MWVKLVVLKAMMRQKINHKHLQLPLCNCNIVFKNIYIRNMNSSTSIKSAVERLNKCNTNDIYKVRDFVLLFSWNISKNCKLFDKYLPFQLFVLSTNCELFDKCDLSVIIFISFADNICSQFCCLKKEYRTCSSLCWTEQAS